MGERWAMVRCECGRHFGSSSKNIINCPRCNSSKNLKILKRYSSSKSLKKDISMSNTPAEIADEISLRLEIYDKPPKKSDNVNKELIEKILESSTTPEGTITINSISNSITKHRISKITPYEVIEILEKSSVVLRNSDGTSTVLQ